MVNRYLVWPKWPEAIAVVLACALTPDGATYHFSSREGDDSRSARQAGSPATPWQSLDKLQSLALSPGDRVLLKKGDAWPGGLTLTASGEAGNPVVIGSYHVGYKPVITGATVIGDWRDLGGGLYAAPVTDDITQVFVDGRSVCLARHPNAGYLSIDSVALPRTRFIDRDAGPGTDWTGASVHVRSEPWSLDARIVKAHDPGTGLFELDRDANYDMRAGQPYFINNARAALDTPGEWFCDTLADTLYLKTPAGDSPAGHRVEGTVFAKGLRLVNCRHLRVEGLALTHHSETGVEVNGGCSDVVLADNEVIDANGIGIDVQGGTGVTLDRNIVAGTNYFGIVAGARRSLVEGNVIRGIGMVERLGRKGLGGGCCTARGLQIRGDSSTVRYNRLDSIGYNGIGFEGPAHLIERNVVKYFCLTVYDGSGIYTWSDSYSKPGAAGTMIRENIIIGGTGGPVGEVLSQGWWANGIYLDDRTHDISVIDNTVANAYHGIYFHNTKRHVARGNNVFMCTDHALLLKEDAYGGAGEMGDNRFADNEVFGLTENRYPLCISGSFASAALARLDSNRYFNPSTPFTAQVSYKPGYPANTDTRSLLLDLAGWREFSGQDGASVADTLTWSSYRVTDTLGGNLIANGGFDSDVSGWSCWPSPCAVSRTAAELDGGALQMRFPVDTAASYALVSSNKFAVVKGASYLLSFTAGAPHDMTLKAIVRQAHEPWEIAGLSSSYRAGPSRSELSFVFTAGLGDSLCRVDLECRRGDTLHWVDNVSLYTVRTVPADRGSRARLAYNDSPQAADVPIGSFGCVDLAGNPYVGTARLAPFRSKILLVHESVETRRDVTGQVKVKAAGLSWRGVGAGGGVALVHLRAPALISLRLYDSRGRVVALLAQGPLAAGVHAFPWSHQAAGAYSLSLRYRGGTITRLIPML